MTRTLAIVVVLALAGCGGSDTATGTTALTIDGCERSCPGASADICISNWPGWTTGDPVRQVQCFATHGIGVGGSAGGVNFSMSCDPARTCKVVNIQTDYRLCGQYQGYNPVVQVSCPF
jgi:hypothetical protein